MTTKRKWKPKSRPIVKSPVKNRIIETPVRLPWFRERQGAMVEAIRQMVEIESPSDNKLAVDRLGRWLAGKFEALGGHRKVHRTVDFGVHLQADLPGRDRRRPALLRGHLEPV